MKKKTQWLIRRKNDELIHYAKGGSAKDHKYISRYKGKNGKWVYVYKNPNNQIDYEAETLEEAQNKLGKGYAYKKANELYPGSVYNDYMRRAYESADTDKQIKALGEVYVAEIFGRGGMPSSEIAKKKQRAIEDLTRVVDEKYREMYGE